MRWYKFQLSVGSFWEEGCIEIGRDFNEMAMNIGKTPHDRKLRQLITVPACNLADKLAASYNHIYINQCISERVGIRTFICCRCPHKRHLLR